MERVYTVKKSNFSLPLVLDSPHSGQIYPEDFGYGCEFNDLKLAEDHYVDDLFSGALERGAAMLCAEFPRSYIDVNRKACDIDENLLSGPWPSKQYGYINPTARSDSGIGLIRRLIRPGIPTYNRKLSADEIQRRITEYYTPYHDALENLLDEAHYKFGAVYHINCHSMPNETARPKRGLKLLGGNPRHADFTLGNRDGKTAGIGFTHELRNFIQSLGYYVTINDPFKGVECVARYGNPVRGRHSIQIEVNKALYMNEITFEKSENYDGLKSDINKIIAFCAGYVEAQLRPMAAD